MVLHQHKDCTTEETYELISEYFSELADNERAKQSTELPTEDMKKFIVLIPADVLTEAKMLSDCEELTDSELVQVVIEQMSNHYHGRENDYDNITVTETNEQ